MIFPNERAAKARRDGGVQPCAPGAGAGWATQVRQRMSPISIAAACTQCAWIANMAANRSPTARTRRGSTITVSLPLARLSSPASAASASSLRAWARAMPNRADSADIETGRPSVRRRRAAIRGRQKKAHNDEQARVALNQPLQIGRGQRRKPARYIAPR